MTPKEALKRLCNICEYHMSLSHKRCPYRSISLEYCDEYYVLLKAVNVLEVIGDKLPDMCTLKVSATALDYNYWYDNKENGNYYLASAEFNSIKEVLGWLK